MNYIKTAYLNKIVDNGIHIWKFKILKESIASMRFGISINDKINKNNLKDSWFGQSNTSYVWDCVQCDAITQIFDEIAQWP